jgi:hypothetical protein
VGQRIEVEPTLVGDTAIFDTDRSITGQDGTGYASAEAAAADRRFPGNLAAEIFRADDAVDNVWVASNTVVVRRTGGWAAADAATIAETIASFFLYYEG